MKSLFGQVPSGTLSVLIVRHWGLLVGLVGGLLIYSASHTETRFSTLIVAIVERVTFAFGVFISPFRNRRLVLVMALADAGMAAVFVLFLSGF